MRLVLLRHGEALSAHQDSQRPLSNRGRADIEVMAGLLGNLDLQLPTIHHSGKRRAQETAEIVAKHISPTPALETLVGLAPEDDPEIVEEFANAATVDLVFAGHLPHLVRFASLLTLGNGDRDLIALPTAGLILLYRDSGMWRLLSVTNPQLVAAGSKPRA